VHVESTEIDSLASLIDPEQTVFFSETDSQQIKLAASCGEQPESQESEAIHH